jgi:hypothetical protein
MWGLDNAWKQVVVVGNARKYAKIRENGFWSLKRVENANVSSKTRGGAQKRVQGFRDVW